VAAYVWIGLVVTVICLAVIVRAMTAPKD